MPLSVPFKIAALATLASRPDGRATLAELNEQIEAFAETDGSEPCDLERFSALAEIDLVQSGLVTLDGDEVWITEVGRSVVRALEALGEPTLDVTAASTSSSMKLIDELIGTEARLKVFDLELRSPDENVDLSPAALRKDNGPELVEASAPEDMAESAHISGAEQTAHPGSNEPFETRTALQTGTEDVTPLEAPAFLAKGTGVRAQPPTRRSFRVPALFGALGSRMHQAIRIWRRHLERDELTPKAGKARANVSPGMFALLSLLVLIICAGAVVALMQIKSLKFEIAGLQKELLPLKERLRKFEQIETSREPHDRSGAEKNKSSEENGADQPAIILSREEIQLVRDYIKPAPHLGLAAAPVNVGDSFTGGTIPLPSPLTDKLPKLQGARFAIRNGAIIIVRRGSHKADAVLGSN